MKQLKNKIKQILYDGHLELSKYYAINFKDIVSYYASKFSNAKNDKIYLNFLITSNAELRIFRPIINSVLNNNNFIAHIFYLGNYKFDKAMNSRIYESDNVSISNSIYAVIHSFSNENYLNIICLDHESFYKQHSVGVDIIKYIKKHGGKTVCVQHGGTQKDNIEGHKTSASQNQIVFGKYVYNKLIDEGLDNQHVFLTGSPLHDNLFVNQQKVKIDRPNIKNKKIVTLITCLHTEYEDRENPEKCYLDYINKIYNSIDLASYFLIIKMHPNDSINPNIYKNQLKHLGINENEVLIIEPNNETSVYDYINISDLIISRSSTIMEESLLLKKKIIAFDLFEDGPSKYYDHLKKYPSYSTVIGVETNLAKEIEVSFVNDSFNEKDYSNIVEDFTSKLDNKSVERILDVFKGLAERNKTK